MSVYIDPHIHMISRTTDDYQRMAYAGCAAISASRRFGPGSTEVPPRASAITSVHLVAGRAETGRAVPHQATTRGSASTPKKRRTSALSRDVIKMIPEFLKSSRASSESAKSG